jgi:4-amino-4-deoxy-L-arabinose transferase-like glycosyltransferase
MALSFRLFGVSTAAARIPLALTVLALALTVETFARRAFHSSNAGLYAALILLSSPGIFLFTRITIPDAMVALWLTLAMVCFYLTEQETSRNGAASRSLCWAFAACCALGVLTKGLIGVIFPLAIVLLYLLLTRGRREAFARIRQLHPLSSLAVFVLIAAPWHILIAIANPTQGHPANLSFQHGHWQIPLPTNGNVHGWLWFYFVNEQFLRYLNLRVPRDYDTVPLWLFWGLCVVWLMPWSAFVFRAVARALPLRTMAWRERLRSHSLMPLERTLLLLAIWASIPLLFFSLSTRQEYYVLPALPAFILMVAHNLDRDAVGELGATQSRRTNVRAAGLLALLGLTGAAYCLYLIARSPTPAPDVELASILRRSPANYALSFGHFLDLNVQAMAGFRLPLALTAVAFGLGLPVAWYLRLPRRDTEHEKTYILAANLATAATAFGFLFAAHLALRRFAPVLGSQQLAAAIAPQLQLADSRNSDLIVVHQEYEFASALAFYLRRDDLHILEGRSSNLWYGSFFSDAPPIFETSQTIAQRWRGRQRIFLWQDLANNPSPLPQMPGPIYVIARSGGKEIVSNQPNRP